MGTLNCLSVNDGDIEISFDNQNAAECIRAKRMITDMLKRGYALLVKQEDGTYTRVLEFDEKHGTYLVADFDPATATEETTENNAEKNQTQKEASEPTLKETRRRGRKKLAMEKSTATAIAPSAGG